MKTPDDIVEKFFKKAQASNPYGFKMKSGIFAGKTLGWIIKEHRDYFDDLIQRGNERWGRLYSNLKTINFLENWRYRTADGIKRAEQKELFND